MLSEYANDLFLIWIMRLINAVSPCVVVCLLNKSCKMLSWKPANKFAVNIHQNKGLWRPDTKQRRKSLHLETGTCCPQPSWWIAGTLILSVLLSYYLHLLCLLSSIILQNNKKMFHLYSVKIYHCKSCQKSL